MTVGVGTGLELDTGEVVVWPNATVRLTPPRVGVVGVEAAGVVDLDDWGLRPGKNFLGGGGLLKLGVLMEGIRADELLLLLLLTPRSSDGNMVLDDGARRTPPGVPCCCPCW